MRKRAQYGAWHCVTGWQEVGRRQPGRQTASLFLKCVFEKCSLGSLNFIFSVSFFYIRMFPVMLSILRQGESFMLMWVCTFLCAVWRYRSGLLIQYQTTSETVIHHFHFRGACQLPESMRQSTQKMIHESASKVGNVNPEDWANLKTLKQETWNKIDKKVKAPYKTKKSEFNSGHAYLNTHTNVFSIH